MILFSLTYVILSFGALTALCVMILRIGAMLGTCPDTGAAARAGALTIATGFAAIGAGGVILIGALLPLNAQMPLIGFLLALGVATLCLGLGFTHAIATLRAVIIERKDPEPAAVKADLPPDGAVMPAI